MLFQQEQVAKQPAGLSVLRTLRIVHKEITDFTGIRIILEFNNACKKIWLIVRIMA
jgi:ppGpp synthetase/RelA/SpoT-type nucleotidyltranferase